MALQVKFEDTSYSGEQLDSTFGNKLIEQTKINMQKFLSQHHIKQETIQKLIENGLDTIDHLQSIEDNDINDLCKECGIKITDKIKLKTAIHKLKQVKPQLASHDLATEPTLKKEIICNPTDVDEKNQSIDNDEKDETKNNMAMVPVVTLDISCFCKFKLGERKLYFCNKCNSDTVYCEDCGRFSHRISAGTDHKWEDDIVEIPEINSTNYQNGERQIINLLGSERYKNVIAPKVRALVTQAFTVNNAVILANTYNLGIASSNLGIASYNAVSAALNAQKLASEVNSKLLQANNALQQASEAVQHAQEMKEIYTVGWSNNPFYWLYEVLYADKAEEARTIYEGAVSAREMAQNKAAEAAESYWKAQKASESAQQLSKIKQIKAGKASIAAQESMTLNMKSTILFTAVLTTLEMFIHGYKYGNNEISLREFWRLSGKSLTRNTASAISSALGAQIGLFTASQLGAEFGNSIFPGFGVIAASGIGLIAGMILSWTMGKIAENQYEKMFPSDEEKTRRDLIHEALTYFHFNEQDIDNPNVFNEKRIKKEYRHAALNAHPDKNDGDDTKWNELSTHYGIVMGLLEQNNRNKKIVKKTVTHILQ
eukprot:233130_1